MEGIKVYSIQNGTLTDVTSQPSTNGIKENDEVHDWICKNPEVVETGLSIIGRRVTCGSKQIDILAIDSEKRMVIIEAKRDLAPREVVGQVIDYASRLDEWEDSEFKNVYTAYCSTTGLPNKLDDKIFDALQDELRILIVCFGVDEDTKRMVTWLAESCGINISFSVFTFAALNGQQFLAMHVVQETPRLRTRRHLDPLRRSLIEAIYENPLHRDGIVESWAGQGGVYGCTLTVKQSGVSGEVSFEEDKRTPILRIGNADVAGESEFRFKNYSESRAAEIANDIIEKLKKAQLTKN